MDVIILRVSWTNGRVTLEERGRYSMKHTDKVAVLTVAACKVTDAGVYELTIMNDNGTMDIEIPVKILGTLHLRLIICCFRFATLIT